LEACCDRDILRRRLTEFLQAERPAQNLVEPLQAQLAGIRQQIERLVDALAAGADDLPTVKTRLARLERERVHLEADLNRVRAMQKGSADIDITVEGLLEALGRFLEVIEGGEAEERKPVVRAFLPEIRIEKATSQAVCACTVCPVLDLPVKLVELRGLELEFLALPCTPVVLGEEVSRVLLLQPQPGSDRPVLNGPRPSTPARRLPGESANRSLLVGMSCSPPNPSSDSAGREALVLPAIRPAVLFAVRGRVARTSLSPHRLSL
jgi:hypothetical protein